tara:strand:+ start:170 stop:907 length:738 start_codon:yes stop_codon:yes gene_type:complete
MADYSYLGSGKVYLRVAGAAAPRLEVGNVSALSFSIAENVIVLKDFTNQGGGTYNEVRRIDTVEVAMTMHDLSSDNLNRALFGTSATTAAGAVTAEVQTAYKNGLVSTARPINTASSVTVTNSAASTTYVANTDYEVRKGGIFVLTAGAITDAQSIKITYTGLAFDLTQAIVNSAQEYEMFFEGLNEARSGKPVLISAFRVKLGAAQNLSLIGEEFAALEVSGKILADSTKGAGLSKYFTVAVAA